ncbi:TonB-dependent receptor [Ideonella sp.]|uniref:TonB-dependent receptor n=1 Tax=Ideonella sp. TaxID=1929293 RepID=UPI003BB59A14
MKHNAPGPLALLPWAAAWFCMSAASASAQSQTEATKPARPAELAPVLITGNPLAGQLSQGASVLTGDRLTLRLAPTLGETLDGLPGVASTWFGPNSNRPTIRGLDGDRVRLLDNAGASVDASNLSFDHAVALDPLVVERIEVLRGPASLLYGGNATGGVVNVLDNRIPVTPVDRLSGRTEVRAGGAASERSASALLEGGAGGLSWHVDGFRRETDDLRTPRFTPLEDGAAMDATDRVRNSAASTRGAAVGASWADADGHVGASVDTYRNRYGVTVEPDVIIRMARERFTLAGTRAVSGTWLQGVNARYGHTRYRHEEVEGTGEVGTTFRSTGDDLRIEARHRGTLGEQGVLGWQAEALDFSALGAEAFVPDTRSRQAAVFALEEFKTADLRWTVGLRAEQARVESAGDAPDATEPRFGLASSRRFAPLSASVGGTLPLSSAWSATAALGRTQRAPAYYELFANGLHLATAAFERGDATLGVERSTHLDLGLNWQTRAAGFKAQAYVMQFSHFISLEASGADVSVDDEDGGSSLVPEYVFRGVRARLAGLELDGHARLLEGPWQLDLSGGLDVIRATNRDSGQPLPRIAPLRISLGLDAVHGAMQAGVQVRHTTAQNRVPTGDTSTPAATIVSASVAYSQRWSAADALWFLKADNIGNELAYSATAVRTVRELAPLPGRSISAGLRLRF